MTDLHDRGYSPPDQITQSVLASWALTLVQPALSVAQRDDMRLQFDRLDDRDPAVTRRYAAGLLTSLARALDDDDPWWQVSARIAEHTCGPNPPDQLGAVHPAGHPFGAEDDHYDLLQPLQIGPQEVDIELLAARGGITPAAAAVAAMAMAHTAESLADVLVSACPLVGEPDMWNAVRWHVIRRRSYRHDHGLHDLAFTWQLKLDYPPGEPPPQPVADLDAEERRQLKLSGYAEMAQPPRPLTVERLRQIRNADPDRQ